MPKASNSASPAGITWHLPGPLTDCDRRLLEEYLRYGILAAGFARVRCGGWGDPKKRPAEKVAEEVRDGIISLHQAREAYGVALDEETLELDEEETAKLRDS